MPFLQVLVKEALQLSARLRLPNSIPNHEVRHVARESSAQQPIMLPSAMWAVFALVKATLCLTLSCFKLIMPICMKCFKRLWQCWQFQRCL